MSQSGIAVLEEIMESTGATRSDIVRLLMAEALQSSAIKSRVISKLETMKEAI